MQLNNKKREREKKFPQCAPANMEISCLLEIGDISRKLRLRCGCQFPWCALGLGVTDKVSHPHKTAGR
jgi:hypothetical protein